MAEIENSLTGIRKICLLSEYQKASLRNIDASDKDRTKYVPVVLVGSGKRMRFGFIPDPTNPCVMLTTHGPLPDAQFLQIRSHEDGEMHFSQLFVDPWFKPINSYFARKAFEFLVDQLRGTNFVPYPLTPIDPKEAVPEKLVTPDQLGAPKTRTQPDIKVTRYNYLPRSQSFSIEENQSERKFPVMDKTPR